MNTIMMYDTFTPVLYWSVVCLAKHRGMLMDQNQRNIEGERNTQEGGVRRREELSETASLFKLADGGGDFDVLASLQFPLTFDEIVHSIYYSLNQLDLSTY